MVNDSVECGKSAHSPETYVIAGCRGRLTNHVPPLGGYRDQNHKTTAFLLAIKLLLLRQVNNRPKAAKFRPKCRGQTRQQHFPHRFRVERARITQVFFLLFFKFSTNVWLIYMSRIFRPPQIKYAYRCHYLIPCICNTPGLVVCHQKNKKKKKKEKKTTKEFCSSWEPWVANDFCFYTGPSPGKYGLLFGNERRLAHPFVQQLGTTSSHQTNPEGFEQEARQVTGQHEKQQAAGNPVSLLFSKQPKRLRDASTSVCLPACLLEWFTRQTELCAWYGKVVYTRGGQAHVWHNVNGAVESVVSHTYILL